VRVFAWNIRQGGGARLSRIADALARHDADILVLSEYRGGASGDRLRAALETLGYGYTTTLAPPPGRSGVLIAARFAFDDYGAVGGGLPEPYRMVGAELGVRGAIAVLRSKPFTAVPVAAAV
jgi:exonuclease III